MSKLKFYLFLIFLVVGFFGSVNIVYGQGLLGITKETNIDNLSDVQIKGYLQQAQAAGYTDDQIIATAQRQGLPTVQVQKLSARIAEIRKKDIGQNSTFGTDNATPNTNRQANSRDTMQMGQLNQKQALINTAPIFGANLFRNGATNSFAPNLNIATPINYIVGPRDQLLINVYGKSIVNWNLTVTPEGNINIPNVGNVHVAGKTIEQVQELIKSRLSGYNFAIDRGTNVSVNLGGNIRTIQVILQGQFLKPAVYSVPSLTDAYAALFLGGGPNDIGSFRKIEVIRNNTVVAHIDLYDFITKGTKKGDITLRDMDIIRIPTYDVRIELKGQVKIPGLFEVLPGETLKTILDYAGGFTDQAYTKRIQTIQISDQQRRIEDVFDNQYATLVPKRGDRFIIGQVLDRYENRVTIKGAIFKPGDFELKQGLTVAQLIKNAGGLKEDAFTGRASLIRLNPDNTTEQLSINIADAMADKPNADIALKREDILTISSIFDLRDKYTVSIKGEVRLPGEFAYADSMKVADLIIRGGGFSEGASTKRIEVSRRVYDSDPRVKDSKVANVFTVDLKGDLIMGDANFTLKPYDIVSVYSLPGYEVQKTVQVEGEVIYPGPFIIQKKNEKVSDIIARAGGLTGSADVDGASLKRDNVIALNNDKNKLDTAEISKEQIIRLNRLKRTFRDSTSNFTDNDQLRNNFVGIDLKNILENPGSPQDLILENGDVLRVPKKQQTVKVNGEVLFPSAVVYADGKSMKDYILNAGGFSPSALRKGAYVVYANGTVKGTRRFLFFLNRPKIKPGSEIFVPKEPVKKDSLPEIIAITTSFVSVGAIILGVISLRR